MLNTITNTNNTNPIFSSYNVRSADFNENMDEYVKSLNDLYIEEQKKKQADKKNTNINSAAIQSMPKLPDFLREEYEQVYKLPEWLERLNVCSPDEIAEWKKQGGMGIAEAWKKHHGLTSIVPYINTTRDAADAINVSVLLNRAKKGEELTYEQKAKLVDYLRDIKELQVRGFTFGGGTVNAILSTIPYMEEFAIGLATSESGVGLASLGKTLSTIGAKKAARKAVEKALEEAAVKSVAPAAVKTTVPLSAAKKIYKDTFAKTVGMKAVGNVGTKEILKETAKAMPKAVVSSAKFGLTKMPETFIGGIADRQIATGVYVTDMGDSVFTDSEHLAVSLMKSFGDSTFEALTETAGWTFSPVLKYFAKPIQKILPKKFFTGFEKLVSGRYGMSAAEALRKYGYDGIIEEMGEEVLNRFLCQTFGINGLDEYNFDGFMNNVFYADNPSKWGQEAISFAVAGAGGHIFAGASSQISEEWKKKQYEKNINDLTEKANRYIQSPEQFYLEQGLIKIKGSQSLAEQKLRKIWTTQNIEQGLQDDILKNMSEIEIRETLKNTIQNETYKQFEEADTEKIENALTEIFMKNNNFHDEKSAKSAANLFAVGLAKFQNTLGLSAQELIDEEMPTIVNEIDEQTKAENIQNHLDNLYNKFDNLSDDADENTVRELLNDIGILESLQNGNIEEKDKQRAEELLNDKTVLKGSVTYNQAAMKRSEFNNFDDFYNDVFNNKNESINKKQFNSGTPDGLNLRVPHDTVLHSENEHILQPNEWKDLLNNIDNINSATKSHQKPRYSGIPVLMKVKTNNGCYGFVLEIFQKNNPIISTAFKDTESNIDNWIKVEAIPNGTETTFSDTRLKDIITYYAPNFNPKIYNESYAEERNLLMVHATKSSHLDDILQSGSFIAPSMAIVKKGENHFNFGDVIFVRNPKKIDYQNDNIHDRDIYSPRLPQADYMTKDGVFVSAYEYDSMERLWQRRPDDFKRLYGSKSFDEYFDGAKKVINMGFTRSGERKTIPYNNQNILNYIKKESLKGGENGNYGLSSLLARLAEKQTSKQKLKETAKDNLQPSSEELTEKWNNIKKEYDDIGDKLAEYYFDKYSFYEVQEEVFYAIAKNNKRLLKEYFADYEKIPKDLIQEVKDFIETAKKLPRSYFEAKPMQEVSLSQFSHVLAKKDVLTEEQKKKLNEYGIKTIEYDENNLSENLENIDKENKIYFQSSNQNIDDDINQRTDKTKYLTNNEVKQLENDKNNFQTYVGKLIKGELSPLTQLRVLKKLTSAYNNIPELKNKKVVITQDVYKKIIDLPNKFNKNHNVDRKRAIKLPELIADPLYILKSHSEGNEHRFVIVTSSKNNIPGEKLSVFLNPKNSVAVVSAYDENINISEEKKTGRVLYDKKKELSKTLAASKTVTIDNSNNSITDNEQNFNPQGEKSADNTILNQEEPIQTNMFYDNVTPHNLHKMNIKGAFIPAENLIELFKNADESTIIHEFAHWWLSRLEKYAAYNEELALDLEEVRKFVKNNGEAFTREQHEKFAVGFEAYIRNGSAKTNRLKRIFEDFKNALISIYDSIKKLVYTENSEQYSFSEADVENLNKLFERLLTTENERIKKTVFERCDDINEKIQQIKANQENEMKELDELWRNNIALNNRKADKKRKVQEYLDLAEKMTTRESKEAREFKQRYKKATFDILSQATGYSRQFIANPRNLEKVELALDKTEDKLTLSGFAPEWAEFYNDTGISYDNEELHGGYELARQAFDVLKDGSFNKVFGEDYRYEEIDKFTSKFEYLANKVKTLKGEEKETALEALYSLFDNMPAMPDDVSSSILEQLDAAGESYEEEQKNDFNKKNYPNIPVVQQLQYYVTKKLSDLKVYDTNLKYKVKISKSHSLYKAIKHATSVNATKKIVRQINSYVITDLENQAKSILSKEIQKQIKTNSKLVKIGTIKKGKFDWKTNTVFAELAELNKLSTAEAFKQYAAIIQLDKAAFGEEREREDENPVTAPEMKTDFQSNLKRKFLEYRSNKINDLNLLATRTLLEDILILKFEGRRAKTEQELEKRLEKDNMKTDLVEKVRLIKNNKLAKNIAKFIMGENLLTAEKTLPNWETALNALFGRDVAQRYSLLKMESDAEVYAYKHYSEFCQKAMGIYGLQPQQNLKSKLGKLIDFANIQPLVNLMKELDSETEIYKEVTYSKETGEFVETGVELSRAEIITLYAWYQNEELKQRLITQYGQKQLDYMFNKVLTLEDIQFAWLLIDTCENMYNDNNEVFIRTTGLSLPKVEEYFPSKTVRIGSEIDMLHENVVRSSNPSFIKSRKICKRIKMKPDSPLAILIPHINKTARYVILSEKLNYLNAIFKDGTVRAAIKEVFDGVELPEKNYIFGKKTKKSRKQRTVGDRIHDTLLNQLASSTFENYVRSLNVGRTWVDTLASNYITSNIGGNLKVMLGQLTSVVNYAENMPVGEWSKRFVGVLGKPKETFKYMLDNCDYLKARLAGNSMNEIMTKITDETDRFRTLRNFCTLNTKYGDILAIAFGGKPYVDYLMEKGLSKEEAFEKFVENTLRAQQSGHNSATSVWQKKQTDNFFARMVFAFNNTSLQYERKFLDALSAKSKGEITQNEFIKALLIYKVFNPVIFTSFLTNLSLLQFVNALFRGDDDAAQKFGIDVTSSMIFANMGAYGMVGMGVTTILRFLMTLIDKNEYKPFLTAFPIISDVEKIGKQIILKNDVTFADWIEALSIAGDDLTGVPVTRISNTIGGAVDITQGNVGVGTLRMSGYGKYRSNVAITGNPPKK